MEIINKKDVQIAQTPHGVDVRKLYSFKHASIVHIELKPGETLKKHITPVDVLFYVLEGKGFVEIGNEKKEVLKDHLIFSPAKKVHRLWNDFDENFSFLVIKVPTPTEETKIL